MQIYHAIEFQKVSYPNKNRYNHILDSILDFSTTLLIDNREKRNQSDRHYIYEEIAKNNIQVDVLFNLESEKGLIMLN